VQRVEEDTVMTTFDFVNRKHFQSNALLILTSLESNTVNWGLASISSRTKDATDYLYDSSAGQGNYNYAVDTGVRITHQEFEGTRAVWGYNAVNNISADHSGHGTYVFLASPARLIH